MNDLHARLRAEEKARAEREEREENERQKKLAEADEILKRHTGYPAARVQVYDRLEVLLREDPVDALERLSDTLLAHVVKFIDIHAESYLTLIDNTEILEAYAMMLHDLSHRAWFKLSGLPMGVIQPYTHFTQARPEQIKLRTVLERARYWINEGYRKLASLSGSSERQKPESPRRGYRREVRQWMEDSNIKTVDKAAEKLNVSVDVLKSIMSDKGSPRYGPDTLKQVLKRIGFPKDDS